MIQKKKALKLSLVLLIVVCLGFTSCKTEDDSNRGLESQVAPTLLPTETPIGWQNITQEPTLNSVPIKDAPVNRGHIYALDISPDGKRVAVATLKGVWIYDANTLTALSFYENLVGFYLVWTENNSELMIWNEQYTFWTLTILNVETSTITLYRLEEFPELSRYASWTPNENILAFTSRPGILYIWDVLSSNLVWKSEVEPYGSYYPVWSPNGDLLAVGINSSIMIWERATQQKLNELELDFGGYGFNWFSDISWSPDGKKLAISAGSSGDKLIWEIENDSVIELPHLSEVTQQINWSPDGRMLVLNGPDTIFVLDVSTSEKLQTISTEQFGSNWFIEWMPDNKHVISGGNGNLLALWDTETGQVIHKVTSHID